MNNQIKAEYNTGKEVKVLNFTEEEINQYGLKKVIQFHARKMKLHKYKCNVLFPAKEAKPALKDLHKQDNSPKVYHNRLNRLIARISLKSLNNLMDAYQSFQSEADTQRTTA